MTPDQRRAFLTAQMKAPIEQSVQVARSKIADALAHAQAADIEKASSRLASITLIMSPQTGVLWTGWADLYRKLWRERRLEIGDQYGAEWKTLGNTDISNVLAGVKVATTKPWVLLELYVAQSHRLLGAAMRSRGDLKAWHDRAATDIPKQINHIAITVAYRLNAIAARQVIQPQYLAFDPTMSV